jgi:putative ABC transport system permease protein
MLPDKLFEPGQDPVGQTIVLKGRRFKVIGVIVEKGMMGFETIDNRVFIPIKLARELYGIGGSSMLMAQAAPGVPVKQAQSAVEAAMRSFEKLKPGEPEDFSVNTIDEVTGIVTQVMKVFSVLLYGIGSVALLVAGIGIMNVMLMQVIERTREIGVRRAVGARRRDILRQFLLQALGQAVVGAVLGAVIGVVCSVAFCLYLRWKPYLEPQVFAIAAGFSIAICVVFGIYPATYAARLKPIDCLRYE